MQPSNPIETMTVYASGSVYRQGPSEAQQTAGTVPLDTLPADWWNWLWEQITTRINEAASGMGSVYDEILSVLEAAQVEPSATSVNQLLISIQAIARTYGTSTVAGAVKSSSDSGKVLIDENGYMTPNGMGVPASLNTTQKSIVSAINEVLAAFNAYVTSNDSVVSGLSSGKAPNNHASSETTYGVGTGSDYGHLKISDTYQSEVGGAEEGVAASQKALYEAYDAITSTASSIPTGTIFEFAGPTDKVPAGYVLCDGRALSRTDYARLFSIIGTTYGAGDGSTTFNVPNKGGRVGLGADSTYALGATGGATTVTLTTDQMPSHSHTTSSQSTTTSGGPSTASTGGPSTASTGGASVGHTHSMQSHTHSGTTGGMSANTSHSHSIYGPTNVSGYSSVPDTYAALICCNRWCSWVTMTCSTSSTSVAHTHSFTTGGPSTGSTGGQSADHSHSMQSHTHSMQSHTHSYSHTHGISSCGGGGAHNNMQPYIALNYIIKV